MTPRTLRLSGLAGAIMGAAILLSLGCGNHSAIPTQPNSMSATTLSVPAVDQLQIAIQTQELFSGQLMALPGVVGTGAFIDDLGKPEVVVMLANAAPSGVPSVLNGVKVVQVVTGLLRPWSLTGTYRPVPIGVSAGNDEHNVSCVPGTIGAVVTKGGQQYLLSANHVVARQNQAQVGEDIIQPSQPDLPNPCSPSPATALVAHLSDFEPVVYDGHTQNTMDAAIALVDPSVTPSCSTPAGGYGFPGFAGTLADNEPGKDPRVPIMKMGRTTELTHGTTKAVNVKAKITFSSGTALFVNQILTSPGFGDAGDSGALVVIDTANKISIGMLIGGGTNGSGIVSPLVPILQRFQASLCTQ
jgi:hypothetical protein